MKKLFIFALLLTAVPMVIYAQDDMYFTPKKAAKEKKEAPQSHDTSQPVYYSGSNRDVDEYNRHGHFGSHYQVLDTDSDDNQKTETALEYGVYPDTTYVDTTFLDKYYSVIDDDDFDYTRRMCRWDGFYDPWFDYYRWGYGPYWHTPWNPWDSWFYSAGWYDSWYDPWYYGWGWSGWGFPYHYWIGWGGPAWNGHGYHYAWGGPNGARSYRPGALPRTAFGNRPLGGSASRRNYVGDRSGNRTYVGRNGSFTGRSNNSNWNATHSFSSRGNTYSAPASPNRSFGGGFSGGGSSGGGRSGGSFGGGGHVSSGGHR